MFCTALALADPGAAYDARDFEGKLEWDSAKLRFTNKPEANEMLKPKFRKGWQFA